MAEAWLEGPRIKARSTMPGGDWMRVGADGLWRPDVRVQFTTDDGVTVLLHYSGLVKPNARFEQAATDGAATRFEDQYLRQVMRFDTGDRRYLWNTTCTGSARPSNAANEQMQRLSTRALRAVSSRDTRLPQPVRAAEDSG